MSCLKTLKRIGKDVYDKIATSMQMVNFTGNSTLVFEVLMVDLTVGSMTSSKAFSMVDAKISYIILLGRDWIHSNPCILSRLHQTLMF